MKSLEMLETPWLPIPPRTYCPAAPPQSAQWRWVWRTPSENARGFADCGCRGHHQSTWLTLVLLEWQSLYHRFYNLVKYCRNHEANHPRSPHLTENTQLGKIFQPPVSSGQWKVIRIDTHHHQDWWLKSTPNGNPCCLSHSQMNRGQWRPRGR